MRNMYYQATATIMAAAKSTEYHGNGDGVEGFLSPRSLPSLPSIKLQYLDDGISGGDWYLHAWEHQLTNG